MTAPSPAPPPAVGNELDPWRLAISTLVAIVVFMGVLGIIGYWFREPMMAAGRWFVGTLGGPGVAIGFYVPDAFTVPIPNDAFLALGRAGNMATLPLVGWALLGSLAGGSTGWFLGRKLRGTARIARFLEGRGAGLDRALRRHGLVAVAVAAITPLPYSVSAWAAGSTQMAYGPFVAVSLLRVIRIVGVLYLIDLGLMSVT